MKEGLLWTENLTPIDPRFEDKYFAEEGGLDESRYVFLGQNRLADRFQSHDEFSIGELGFGTGLNFFSTWQEWRKSRQPNAWLRYMACEINPLSASDIRRTTSVWPELSPLVEKFLTSYRPFFPGFHRILLADERIELTLLIGDAADNLKKLSTTQTQIDAWFLDGFAPRKNPEMWSESIFKMIYDLSHPSATFATFTAAGWVKRNLQAAGFEVKKFEGFGRKKEMLCGLKSGARPLPPKKKNHVIVVGAGMAGCFAAYSLASRGYKVQLLDQHPLIAAEASGNPAAVMMPVLTAVPTSPSELTMRGLRFLVDLLERNDCLDLAHRGVLQVFENSKQEERTRRAFEWLKLPSDFATIVSPQEAKALSGLDIQSNAIWFPWSASRPPRRLCAKMVQLNPLIEWRPSTHVKNIEKSDSGWAIQTDQESLSAEILVLANANNAMKFLDLPMRPIWGQVFWADHAPPSVTVSGECTVARTDEGYLSVGSTYDRENLALEVRPEENKKLVEEAQRVFGISIDENSIISARTGLRATTPKKIPMIGRVDEDLYVNVGFGSRGFVFAPLAAEILTYFIDGGIPPVENHLLDEIESQRIKCKISSSASISLRQ